MHYFPQLPVFKNVLLSKFGFKYYSSVTGELWCTFKLKFVLLKEDRSIRIRCYVRVFSKVPWSMLELKIIGFLFSLKRDLSISKKRPNHFYVWIRPSHFYHIRIIKKDNRLLRTILKDVCSCYTIYNPL